MHSSTVLYSVIGLRIGGKKVILVLLELIVSNVRLIQTTNLKSID